MLDSDFFIDMKEVKELIQTSDILLIRFATVDKRLLMDSRTSEAVGPKMLAVSRASSVEARFRELKTLRPQFPLPDHIMSFHWPKSVSSIRAMGVMDMIADRFRRAGFESEAEHCYEVLSYLEKRERSQLVSAITGEGYSTLWQKT
ncbi:MAG: hypothetical protein EXR50_06030 [Dehalococcoidia bacterium]|nr:hypothetical protein [Dehalococcoidia bacterium]